MGWSPGSWLMPTARLHSAVPGEPPLSFGSPRCPASGSTPAGVTRAPPEAGKRARSVGASGARPAWGTGPARRVTRLPGVGLPAWWAPGLATPRQQLRLRLTRWTGRSGGAGSPGSQAGTVPVLRPRVSEVGRGGDGTGGARAAPPAQQRPWRWESEVRSWKSPSLYNFFFFLSLYNFHLPSPGPPRLRGTRASSFRRCQDTGLHLSGLGKCCVQLSRPGCICCYWEHQSHR